MAHSVDPLALTDEPSSDEEDEAEPPPPQHGGQRTADDNWALWRAMDLGAQVLRRLGTTAGVQLAWAARAAVLVASPMPRRARAAALLQGVSAGKHKKKTVWYGVHGGPRPGVYRSYDEAKAAGAIEGHAVDHRAKMLDTYEDALAFALGVWLDPRTGQRFGYMCRTTPLHRVGVA